MCSISGIYSPTPLFEKTRQTADAMTKALTHRGPDDSGKADFPFCALRHNRLSVMDPARGAQPMTATYKEKTYTVVYNGELYQCESLRRALEREGVTFKTTCDTEVLLYAYAVYGEACLDKLNGIFAFAVYDHRERKLFCARDRLGVKPFFFTYKNGNFYFASEIKAFLVSGVCTPTLTQKEVWELLFLSPVTLPGGGIFKEIRSLRPGECCTVSEKGIKRRFYWQLKAKQLRESEQEMIEHTGALLTDAIEGQLTSDVPLCTFLSGGLDSSLVSAVASAYMKRNGRTLSTYSFEYEGNDDYAPTLFQPNKDDAYARLMADHIGSLHTVLTVPTLALADALENAMLARDFPGQADIDSSLLWFCARIKENHTVALSGECADEIFGGYPWFYRSEMLSRDFFPWIHDPMGRASLFRPEIAKKEEGFAYLSGIFHESMAQASVLDTDSDSMRLSRIATHLSMTYFMTSLLERKDRMSMASAVEVRVPFADHRICEYVYNVPWEVKFAGETEKALLRNAMAKWLPNEVLYRKKSPYPKTHDAAYEKEIYARLQARLEQKNSPLAALLDKTALENLKNSADATWFGQLMAKAQLFAWLYQTDLWLSKYGVEIEN
ncbi:MAG: asparagine synthase (glutamine-hydrolyzing) [Clostridia bacterium]|nr:asparagine synthase (glutamine-hydrolyzing) [Clostridia bacterium]